MTNKSRIKEAYIGVFGVIILSIIFVLLDEDKAPLLKADFTRPLFVLVLLFIITLTILGMVVSKDKKINVTTRHAIIAFLAAYFAHINMVFVPYFMVGILVYFTYDPDDHKINSEITDELYNSKNRGDEEREQFRGWSGERTQEEKERDMERKRDDERKKRNADAERNAELERQKILQREREERNADAKRNAELERQEILKRQQEAERDKILQIEWKKRNAEQEKQEKQGKRIPTYPIIFA